jgi:hypothetical protein
MIKESELPELLIFDLETSSEFKTFDDLAINHPRKAELWKTKVEKARVKDPVNWNDHHQAYIDHTALSPEFGRIVCASFLHIVGENVDGKAQYRGRIKSFYDSLADETSEKELILKPVEQMLENIGKTGKNYKLCGHNIKKFDIPFLGKRLLMNNMSIPSLLQTYGKKPWELSHVDTGELWSMGVWDQYVSLDLLTCALSIPSPKESMAGKYVGKAFWEERKYNEIKLYCEEDIKAVARICHKLSESILPLEF